MKIDMLNEGLCRLIVETSGLSVAVPIHLHWLRSRYELPGPVELYRPWRNLYPYDERNMFLVGLYSSTTKDQQPEMTAKSRSIDQSAIPYWSSQDSNKCSPWGHGIHYHGFGSFETNHHWSLWTPGEDEHLHIAISHPIYSNSASIVRSSYEHERDFGKAPAPTNKCAAIRNRADRGSGHSRIATSDASAT
jgi:hypothetical protein